MSLSEPEEGATVAAQLVVGINDLASALPLAVLPTARLVALMEIASARVLIPLLGAGQLSVGISIDVTHTAPTPAWSPCDSNCTVPWSQQQAIQV
jgi:fluoroacetyl-CoA thioesterase